MNSLQVKSTAHVGKCPMRIALDFTEKGKKRVTFLCSLGRPGGRKQVPEKNIWLVNTKEHSTCKLLMCLLCDWWAIVCKKIYVYTRVCSGAGERLFPPTKSGVITQPVYFGVVPSEHGRVLRGQDSFGTFFCCASLPKHLQVWSWSPEKGRCGESAENDCWAAGCGCDVVYSSVMIFWQTFHFLASGRSCTYQKQHQNRPF